MSTLESTVSMLEALPEDDLTAINRTEKQFYLKQDHPEYKPLTKVEMIDALKTAREHAEEGPLIEGHALVREMREKSEERGSQHSSFSS